MRLNNSNKGNFARLLATLALLGAFSLALFFTSPTIAQTPPIATISECPASVDEGETFSCDIELTQNAPSGGITVSVEISDSLAADDVT